MEELHLSHIYLYLYVWKEERKQKGRGEKNILNLRHNNSNFVLCICTSIDQNFIIACQYFLKKHRLYQTTGTNQNIVICC